MIQPGVYNAVKKADTGDEEAFSTVDALLDVVRNMAPDNLIQACFWQYKTERVEFQIKADEQISSLGTKATGVRLVGHYVEGTNTLGLIVWSFVFGVTLSEMGEQGKVPGDDCPLVWGRCSHCLHMHCILKWLNSQQVQQQCPMCRSGSSKNDPVGAALLYACRDSLT